MPEKFKCPIDGCQHQVETRKGETVPKTAEKLTRHILENHSGKQLIQSFSSEDLRWALEGREEQLVKILMPLLLAKMYRRNE